MNEYAGIYILQNTTVGGGGGGGRAGGGKKMKMESQGKKFKKWREKGGKLHEKKGNGP